MDLHKDYNIQFSETFSIHLDLIRAISAQLIVISHGLEGYLNIQKLHSAGASGLTFLFLISGILIAYSTFTKMNNELYSFKQFFISRFSRIYSLFLLILGIVTLIDTYQFVIVLKNPPFNYNLPTFFFNLLLLNDSALGYSFFGSSGQLWTLPIFWWTYLVFGWLILGKRSTSKKYLYFFILALFCLILISVIFGYQFQKKITSIIIWILGVFFSYSLNKLNKYIQKKTPNTDKNNKSKIRRRLLNFISLFISIVLFISSLFILSSHHNAFAIDFSLLLGASFCFFLIFSQYTQIKYPKMIKKIIRFMASYSFTLYLLHVSIFFFYKLFINEMNNVLLFLLIFIIINILSILVASFSEMQASKIKKLFLKKFS